MLLKNGSTGSSVAIVQNNLNILGYDPQGIDCVYGDNTETAVKEFQKANGLEVDGIVGDYTWNELLSKIKDIQAALNEHGFNLSLDGVAGINTYSCVLRFQEDNNLTVDGIVSPETKEVLFKNDCSISLPNSYDISDNGINFIADYEDFYSKPYRGLDSQNQTIGYGHVIMVNEEFESLTVDEARELLKKDLCSFVNAINSMLVGISLSQNQFDSIVSFAYNCGEFALKFSTLLKDIKANAPIEKIKEDFLMWCNCNGKRSLGLYRRRYDEFEMYSEGDYTRSYRDFD